MKKVLILLWSCLSFISKGQTVTDIDGNVYTTVKIGNQVWMQENLRVTKFNDGTPILKEIITINCDNCVSMNWDTLHPMYSVYPSWSKTNIVDNGLVYNGLVTTSDKNVCPIDWHVPSVFEFELLSKYTGGNYSWNLTIKDSTSLFKIGNHKHHRPNNYYYGESTTFSRDQTVTHLWTSTKVTYIDSFTCGINRIVNAQYSYGFWFIPRPDQNNILNAPIKSHRGYGYYIRCVKD